MTLTLEQIEKMKANAAAWAENHYASNNGIVWWDDVAKVCDMALRGLEARDRIARLESVRGALREAFRVSALVNNGKVSHAEITRHLDDVEAAAVEGK